jgi:protein-arginine kinase activator protein McsA
MNNEQRRHALSLRKQGLSKAAIANSLSISVNTVKSFFRRYEAQKLVCRNCGAPLEQTPKHRPKAFCCSQCRVAWWKTHRDQMQQKAIYRIVCAHCGKEFESYGNKGRKYCCHPCYIQDRFDSPQTVSGAACGEDVIRMVPSVNGTVREQIMAIRDEGETNMLDANTVQQLALNHGFTELANFIGSDRKAYVHFILTGETEGE